MIFSFLSLLLFARILVAHEEIIEEDGVLVLGDDSLESAIEDYPYLLVEFYAPWCGHCKSLAPEYSKAAKKLSKEFSAVKLAKVDATVHKTVAEKFEVRGYPTLKFFKKGVPQEYAGGRTADSIVEWVKRKSGPSAKTLDSKEDASDFVDANNVAVIGFFQDVDGVEVEAFMAVADNNENVKFGITTNEDVFELYEVTKEKLPCVVLLKNFDEGRNDLEGDLTEENIAAFIASNHLPLVADFSKETAPMIFQGSVTNHFLIFIPTKHESRGNVVEIAKKVAKDVKGEILFVTVDTDVEDNTRVAEFFGIVGEEIPTFRLTATSSNDMLKYKPKSGEFTEENIRLFVDDFKAGKLAPHLKSQELPIDWDAKPVKVLVGLNFEQVVFDDAKDVFVEFYAPWCGHCKQLEPIWEKLGEAFKDNEKVVVAKIDMTANELDRVKVNGFPTIKLFKADTNLVVDYDGGRTLEDFTKFLDNEAMSRNTKEEL